LVQDDLDTTMEVFKRGPFSLSIGGLLQLQAAVFVGDEAMQAQHDPADTEGFRIRRARFGFGGSLHNHWKYYLAVDMRDAVVGGNEVLDAKIAWTRFAFAQVSLGVDKVPFSFFNLQSSSRLELIERPITVQMITPDRRVGATVLGEFYNLQYAVGLYNGSDGVIQGNTMAGIAAAAQVQYHIFGKPEEFVPGPFRLSLGGGFMYNDGAAVDAVRASGHLDMRIFRIRLQGEFLWESTTTDQDPAVQPTQAGDVKRWGAVGELTVFLWQEYIQMAIRYEYLNDNNVYSTMGSQQIFSGGLNGYLFKHKLKLQLNYTHRQEIDGISIDNDIAFAMIQAMF